MILFICAHSHTLQHTLKIQTSCTQEKCITSIVPGENYTNKCLWKTANKCLREVGWLCSPVHTVTLCHTLSNFEHHKHKKCANKCTLQYQVDLQSHIHTHTQHTHTHTHTFSFIYADISIINYAKPMCNKPLIQMSSSDDSETVQILASNLSRPFSKNSQTKWFVITCIHFWNISVI